MAAVQLGEEDESALYNAARRGDLKQVEYLLEHGGEIDEVDIAGNTSLHIAAAKGNEDLARFLLTRGADEKRVGQFGRSLLHFAAYGGAVGLVKYLLELGQEIDKVDHYGDAAVHVAVWAGKEEMARFLLSRGADGKRLGRLGRSLLHHAAEGGAVGLVKYLLEKGHEIEEVDKNGFTALHFAAWNGRKEALRLLLSRGAALNKIAKTGDSVLHLATQERRSEIITFLLEHCDAVLEVAEQGKETPAYLAAASGDADTIRLLLSYGASIGKKRKEVTNRRILSILEKDSGYRDENETKSSFSGVSIGSSRKEKQLIGAVRNGDLKSLMQITKKSMDTVRGNPQILLEACRYGRMSIVKYLVEELNIPINPKGTRKSTPLHEAARRGHLRILKFLLGRGTLIGVRNEALETPLHEAARWGKWPAAALLIRSGARVSAINKDGKTALKLAEENKWEKAIEVLENPGALVSSSGSTVISLQVAYEKVMKGAVDLDESKLRELFVPEHVRGIRDLWAGHKILEIAKRLGKIPKAMGGHYFYRRFYHAIVGKLYSDQEMDIAEEILDSAEDQGLLRTGGACATLGDELTRAGISESIGPVLFDLNIRVQGLEQGMEQVRSAIYQIKRDHDRNKKQSMYLAFLRLGLSFVPMAGGALGSSIDALGKVIGLMNESGLELGDLCGLSTSMIDAVHPLMDGVMKTDLGDLESLKERLSPEFIGALPELPREQFLNMVKECFERGIDELRGVLDELLKEAARNEDFLRCVNMHSLGEEEKVEIKEVSLENEEASPEEENVDSKNNVRKSRNLREYGDNKETVRDSLKRTDKNLRKGGDVSQMESFGSQSSSEQMEVRGPETEPARKLRDCISELEILIGLAARNDGGEDVSRALKFIEDTNEAATQIVKELSKYGGNQD